MPPSLTASEWGLIGGSSIMTSEMQKQWDIGASDETFTLAFHPNIKRGEPSSPVVRHGTIADFPTGSDTFLVDSFVFPRNSGSPVILKPGPTLIGSVIQVTNIKQPVLVGVVIEYIPYIDVAISPQAQRPRITFEENSGLLRAVRAEKVTELLQIVMPPTRP
jgi:hypothetical protein